MIQTSSARRLRRPGTSSQTDAQKELVEEKMLILTISAEIQAMLQRDDPRNQDDIGENGFL